MKRFISLLCCLVMLASSTVAHASISEQTLVSNQTEAGSVQSVCVVQSMIYFLSDKGMYQWDSESGTLTKWLDLSYAQRTLYPQEPTDSFTKSYWVQAMRYLFTDGVQLYGLHPYSGQISVVTKDQATPLCTIPSEQLFYDDLGMQSAKNIVSIQYIDGNLYMILSSFTQEVGMAYELYSWNLTDAQMNLLPITNASVIYSGTENELLLRIMGKEMSDPAEIWLYDIQAQSLAKCLATDTNAMYNACIWVPESQTLYYIDQNATIKSLNADGTSETKAYLPLSYISDRDTAYLTDEGMYVYASMGHLFTRDVSLAGEREQKTIRIMGSIDSNIAVAYAAAHPDISVVMDSRDTGFLSIQESMVSSDAAVDLYIVKSTRSFAEIRDKGYAASMNENEQLVSTAKDFYPAIADELFRDGQLLAFPAGYTAHTWTLNKTKWDALGLGEYPTTFEALYQAVEMWDEQYAAAHEDYTLLESHEGTFGFVALLIKQYLLEHETQDSPVSFNDATLKNALQVTMDHRDTLDQISEEKMPIIMNYPQYFGAGFNDSDEVYSVAPPALSGQSPQPVMATMELFILNPLSSYSKEALDFVEFYLSHKDATLRYSLTPTLNEPIRPIDFESRKAETLALIDVFEDMLKSDSTEEAADIQSLLEREKNRYQRIEDDAWEITAQSIEIYRGLAEHLAVPTKTIFSNDRGGLGDESMEQFIRQFVDGQISLDQFIEKIDSLANMIYLEQK